MPRPSSTGSVPSWDRLFELAAPQAGYVTNEQATEAGYSRRLLQFYVEKGRLERSLRGILRLVHYPVSDHEDLVPTWLWSDKQGVFSHETALMLHDLSDALPSKHHMILPASWGKRRLRVPKGLILKMRDLPKSAIAWMGPVPVTTPLQTVIDASIDHVQPDLVQQAIRQGVKRGLFSKDDVRRGLARKKGAK
ncbi:MAG: type IV toxin-antitoxin system AbiEi family antitoxin domain-containing protein [Polyangiaceae bacterium]|nr:type IV toxin-antitoxin system AbiEi family antitoxin domain-containing protein [Polyangiaceae bacterium]